MALYLFLIAFILFVGIRNSLKIPVEDNFILDVNDTLINRLVAEMSIEEKVAQLFIVSINQAQASDKTKIDSVIQHLNLGGIIFKQTGLLDRLIITNYLNSKAIAPLFIASQHNAVNQANCQLPMGKIINALNDTAFAYQYLDSYADVLQNQNVNIELSNYLTSVDSCEFMSGFSDDKQLSVRQSLYFRKALFDRKIISCVNFHDSLFLNKDTLITDSLFKLKKVKMPLAKFWAVKMPEKVADSIKNKTCSNNFEKFHQKYYNFKGLIISELQDSSNLEDLKLLFKAGVGLFMVYDSLKNHIDNFKELVENGDIEETELDRRLKRILSVKQWTVPKRKQLKSAEVKCTKILNANNIKLSWNLHQKSLCLIKNRQNSIPFMDLLNEKTHLIILGENKFTEFRKVLSYYTDFSYQKFKKISDLDNQNIKKSQNIIVLVDKNFNADTSLIKKLKKIDRKTNFTVISFASKIEKWLFADAVLFAYNNNSFSQINVAQVIAGSVQAKGKLVPELTNISSLKHSYSGINRLQYTVPEIAGFSHHKLKRLDSLIEYAIEKGAMPGAQILAAKNGKVFLYKSYGHHSGNKRIKVKNSDIYDIASITKVAATTMVAMKLYENKKIKLTDTISKFISDTMSCTIRNLSLLDLFIHKSGLQSNMPIAGYFAYPKNDKGEYDKYYSNRSDSLHGIKIVDDYYFRSDCIDSIAASLYNVKVDINKNYLYSDVNFNIIFDILNKKINGSYVDYLNEFIYNPLQLRNIVFCPLNKFEKSQIAPTEYDRYWRKQLVHGTVHDESAALYGGVAGNAGLFSNANDIAILFQMLISEGSYANAKIFDKSTIEYFTTAPENSKRALGFNLKHGSFGHTGFTGCVVWANPETQFVFVFLSNRINPSAKNRRLQKMKVRRKAYNLILQSTL